MKRRTFVYIACSPHPRVGTTLTARLLTDYFLVTRRPVKGFDTNPYESTFARAHPDVVSVVDIATTRGQIAMFDRLVVADEAPKIVDLWQPSYRRFFDVAEDVGFLEEAQSAGITPILLYHADTSATSLEACWQLSTRWQGMEIVIVVNEATSPPDSINAGYLSRFPAERTFRVPRLGVEGFAAIEEPPVSLKRLLWEPADDAPAPPPGLAPWTTRIFTQFKTFEIRHALEDTEYL
jgi:hypothetical protein